MSTTLPHSELDVQTNYLNADYGWKSWLFTTDHKRIALLYLFSITAFFFIGGTFAVGMRLNLVTPNGLGMLALWRDDAETMRKQIRETRALTSKPFGVNLNLE